MVRDLEVTESGSCCGKAAPPRTRVASYAGQVALPVVARPKAKGKSAGKAAAKPRAKAEGKAAGKAGARPRATAKGKAAGKAVARHRRRPAAQAKAEA